MTNTRQRTALTVACVAVAVAGLTGCGGDDTPQQPTAEDVAATASSGEQLPAGNGTIDPCALVSSAELTAVIGADVAAAGPAKEEFRGRSCDYTFPTSGVLDEGTLTVTAWHGSEFFLPGTIGPARAGIGDEAQDDSEHGVVLFRKGEDVVQVHVIAPGLQKTAVAIAERAADAV